ncbi:MFS transporter [Nocardioides turkmenicus]|uniref:MFS transporter n=1 Tax=Nocardioides turkmenicus TaxID=2711220 RepID=UPI0019D301E0|nr:MFS transporter [Nocardioides sp. KC13]
MLRQRPGSRNIWQLSVSHGCVDVYQGAVAALVPFFITERGYGYAAAAGVVLAASLLSSLVQPVFGVITDRRPLPWLLPASTLTAGAGVALSGLMPTYPLTVGLIAVSGVGVAAYHPESARVARAAAGSHTSMAWFSLGGNLGFIAAPVLVLAVVQVGGLAWTPLLMIPALAGTVLAWAALRATPRSAQIDRSGTAAQSRDDWPSFLRLSLAVMCRSIVFVGLSTFVAVHVADQVDGGTVSGTTALWVLYVGGGIGTVLGGRLATRWDRVTVVRWSALVTVLAVAGVVLAPGPVAYVFVASASVGLYVPFSLFVTLAQDYLPSRVGTASGVTLGLTITVGGLASPAIGALADNTADRTAAACRGPRARVAGHASAP